MPFFLSPGVNFSEIDLTTIVPAVGTTEGAFAGAFRWGPLDVVMNIGNEIELVNTFFVPDNDTFKSFFTCSNFLSYARRLRVVRAANTASIKNASSNASGILIKNKDLYELDYSDMSGSAAVGQFVARYPGSLGNSLKVSLWASSNSTLYSAWTYADEFNGAVGTSEFVSNVNGVDDEMHIIVIDEDGKFSGVSNTVLEKFSYVSKASDATNNDGSSNYYVNRINESSKYIYIFKHAISSNGQSETSTWGTSASNTTYNQTSTNYTSSLSGGVDAAPTNANLQTAYDKFANGDEIDVSLILTGAAPQVVSEYVLDNIAGVRRDCVVFVSPEQDQVVNNSGLEVTDLTTYRNLFNSTSYGFMDCNWKYQFDKYNNTYRWLPLNGDIAGLCVRTDFELDPWFSPAGFNRGHIKNVVKLAWNPSKGDRDDLYKIGINPVVTFPGEGTILYGDKTMLTKPSAFDRINVRRLFIVLEKAISRAAKYSLFEFNDEFTRAAFVALVEPFLRDVQGRRGIFDFRVVCDSTNNTPEVIDRNEFIGDIYIKPARSINFIQLNFIAVRTGVAFEEVVGRF